MPQETMGAGQEALVGAILALVGLGLVPVAVAAVRHVFPMRVVFFARWGFSQVMLSLLAALLLSGLTAGLLAGEEGDFTRNLGAGFAWLGTLSLLIAYFMGRTHPDLVEAVGLERRLAVRAVLAGLLALVMLLPGIYGLGLLWPWAVDALGGEYTPQPVLLGFADLQGSELWWGVALAVVLVPLVEELVFRSWLQPLLCQNLGEVGGVVLTSAVFASLHGESAFGPIFALSWVLGAVMLRTHRLWAPWAMHAAFNALNLALFLGLPESRDLLT